MSLTPNLKIGEILIEKGLITHEQLDEALELRQKTKQFLGTTLINLGYITEEELLPVLSEKLNIEYVRLNTVKIDHEAIKKVPAKFASHYHLMPIKLENNLLTVAVTDPLDIRTVDDLKLLLGLDIKAVLAGEKDISEMIRKFYGVGAATLETMVEGEKGKPQTAKEDSVDSVSQDEELVEDASVTKLVNQIISQALRDRATDIHIEPFENKVQVRFRVDGVLYDASVPESIKYFQSAIVSRIKIMANLDIAEKRLPQDGRISMRVNNTNLDMRVSTLPTPYGESVDIRLLSSNVLLGLESLGLSDSDFKILSKLINRPHGIVFVTGPTGSGKTTTLYSSLSKINDKEKKIITIEDPIEYQLEGITQIQVSQKIGLSFASGLRTMLRHDPDIMMVGEVRDLETAEIAIRAALTGHLVFSTLHTNDAAGAITRLLDMGLEPFLVSSSLIASIAQRLVRIICPECKEKVSNVAEAMKELGVEDNSFQGDIFIGKGCDSCKSTGYRGRTAIYEILEINDKVRDMIIQHKTVNEIKKVAVQNGMKTLRHDGWQKIKQGLTTVSEVLRVTKEEEL